MYARTTASGVRSSWVTSAISSERASSIWRSCSSALLRLGLLAALLDDPGEQVGDRLQLGDVGRAEQPRLLGLDVEDADDLVVPAQRHAEHRRDEPLLVDPADPQEARVASGRPGSARGVWVAATRPVTPSPNGTRARPIW